MGDDRQVEYIEPDHRLIGIVAVIVPGPGWRDDKVTRPHAGLLAVHRRIGTLAVENITQGRLAVAVRRRDLAGQDQLPAAVEHVGDEGLAAQCGIFQNQHATLCFLGGQQSARFDDEFLEDVEIPEMRAHRSLGRAGDETLEYFPQRSKIFFVNAPIKILALGCVAHEGGTVHFHDLSSLVYSLSGCCCGAAFWKASSLLHSSQIRMTVGT